MSQSISVIINSLNEEKNIDKALSSVTWADEILVCDMHSEDKTVQIAKRFGAKIIFHKRVGFVEPARNFAVSKASSDWILILDADEEIPVSLKERLIKIAREMKNIDFVKIPRKNIIFGKWIRESQWWPDLNIRFFKKGKVKWSNKIHRPPQTFGLGLDLPAEERWAIVHNNYQTIAQFLERMNRYTTIQANELTKEGYRFNWSDLLEKPVSEFQSRFFANKGYKDGLHGLVLSLLQAFSFMVTYMKLWEETQFEQQEIALSDLEIKKQKYQRSWEYWMKRSGTIGNPVKSFLQMFKK